VRIGKASVRVIPGVNPIRLDRRTRSRPDESDAEIRPDRPFGIMVDARKKASLITDESCLGNPGPGGWACILRFGAVKKELFGYDSHTTNNRMEPMAAIQGLPAFKEPCEVENHHPL